MSIDLTITARQDGTEDTDGMALGELLDTLETLRRNGGDATTRLHVVVNRAHRVRTVTASVTPGQPDHPDED